MILKKLKAYYTDIQSLDFEYDILEYPKPFISFHTVGYPYVWDIPGFLAQNRDEPI